MNKIPQQKLRSIRNLEWFCITLIPMALAMFLSAMPIKTTITFGAS